MTKHHHWIVGHAFQEIVQRQNLWPVCILGPGRFVSRESRFFQSGMVREGDELHADAASPADALDAATRAAAHLGPGSAAPRTVALFDLSDRNLRRHDPASLDKLFQAIR